MFYFTEIFGPADYVLVVDYSPENTVILGKLIVIILVISSLNMQPCSKKKLYFEN